MKETVPNSVRKFADKLLRNSSDASDFVEALLSDGITTKALIWTQPRPLEYPFTLSTPATWNPKSVDFVESSESPGRHSLHGQGAYYCLDPSSIFMGSIFCNLPIRDPMVLDLCAAPGGKTVLASVELSPKHLIANETIGKRHGALVANLRRCGLADTEITKHDPSFFAETKNETVDLVIVDAPCSGQSLLAKGRNIPVGFHPSTINMNANRQKRIVANAAATVRGGGYLAYMTCTFSREENEGVLEWLLKRFPEFKAVEVLSHKQHQSTFTEQACYRLWPQQGFGAGGFTALLQKTSGYS